jgi:hypothetical protein
MFFMVSFCFVYNFPPIACILEICGFGALQLTMRHVRKKTDMAFRFILKSLKNPVIPCKSMNYNLCLVQQYPRKNPVEPVTLGGSARIQAAFKLPFNLVSSLGQLKAGALDFAKLPQGHGQNELGGGEPRRIIVGMRQTAP